jgi:UDP-N-acetyl-2-amino-2-deoxyglucuronate dehydrogenase
VAIDAGSHWLRPLRLWLGEVTDVVAVTGRPYEAMEGESMVRALCRFESGVVASFDAILSPGPTAPLPLFQITGTAGEIVIDVFGRVKLYDGSEPGGTVQGQGGYLESYDHQIADFEAAVLDGTALSAGPESSLGELRGALAMVRSATSGRWEPVW